MLILIIILIVIALLASLIFLANATVSVCYEESFKLLVKIGPIKVYDTNKTGKKPKSKDKNASNDKTKPSKNNIIKAIYKQNGFVRTVQEFTKLVRDIVTETKTTVKHFKFKKLVLDITVASGDAAMTAIEYGAVCTAVYPLIGLIASLTEVGFKKINISSDFQGNKSKCFFSFNIKMRVFHCIIAAYRTLKIYNDFKLRNGLNE